MGRLTRIFHHFVLVVGLLGYRHTVTQERDPTIVAHRYDLFKMSKLQASLRDADQT